MNILLMISLIPLFLIACYVCFGIPGGFIIGRLGLFKDDDLAREIVSIGIGVCLFALVVYLLSMLGLREVIWVYIALGVIGLVYRIVYSSHLFKQFIQGAKSKSLIFWFVLVLGVVGQVAVNAPSGLRYEDGVYFWSSHGHDGIWHIALMDEFTKKQWPYMNPELAGQKLVNYHFFSDLVMSEIGRVFRFDSLDVYFRLMPIFNSLMLGLSAYLIVKKWSGTENGGIWGMFFGYFAGSFGYLVTLPRSGNIVGESIFWVSQTQSVLGNPPHAMAFFILTIYLLVLWEWFQKSSWKVGLVLVILGGALIEFKVYGGLLVLGGLAVAAVGQIITTRKFHTLLLFFVTAVFAMGIYLPNSANSQGFLVWHPWWFIRTMVVAPDRLNLLDWELRRQTYISESNWKRVVWLEGMAFLIFLFGMLGMRFIGFWSIIKLIKNKIFSNYYGQFIVSIVVASFFIPVFFLQKGVAWNAIQFNQYFLLLFGLLAAWSCSDLAKYIKSRSVKWIIVVLIVIVSVPTQIGLLWQFYSNKPLSKVSYKEIEVLNYLKETSDVESIVLTKDFDMYERDKFADPPIPIYAWYGTGYVSAFSSRRTLLADTEQVQIMGYPVLDLIEERKKIFETTDPTLVDAFMKKYEVDYVYLSYAENFKAPIDKLSLALVYGNSDGRLYKVVQ